MSTSAEITVIPAEEQLMDGRFLERTIVGIDVTPDNSDIPALLEVISPKQGDTDRSWKVTFSPEPDLVGVNADSRVAHFSTNRLLSSIHRLAHKEQLRPIDSFQKHAGELIVAQALGVSDKTIKDNRQNAKIHRWALAGALLVPASVLSLTIGSDIADQIGKILWNPVGMFGMGITSSALLGILGSQLDKTDEPDRAKYKQFESEHPEIINGLSRSVRPIFYDY